MKVTPVLFMLCSGFVHFTFASHRLRILNVTETRLTWEEAATACSKANESLGTIYDEDDANIIFNFLQKETNLEFFWLGLHKHGYNVSTWSNGDPLTFSLSDANVTNGEQICQAIEDNTWKGFNCSDKKPFMCYQGNTYTLIEKEKKDWCQAQQYCRRHFTNLVSISNETQNQQVIDKGKNKSFWIGLMHDEWEWSDKSCSTYRQWENTSNFTSGENCTTLQFNTYPLLYVFKCTNFNRAFCSKGHVRIIVIQHNLTWEQAFNYCEANHTGLLQIEDEADQEAVNQWLQYTDVDGPFWISLRQSRVFGFWIWRDRTVAYSNWKDGKPPEMPLSNNCGVIDNGTWSDENCWHPHHFLCEEEISFMKN